MNFGIIGMILCVILLMYLVYLGLSVIVAAPVTAILLMLVTSIPLVEGFSVTFLRGAGGFITGLLGIYLAGTLLGEVYTVSGASVSIARSLMRTLRGKREQVSPVISFCIVYAVGSILVFGGIHVVALCFILLPLSLPLMREANIPRVLAPAMVISCSFTGALTMPGAPQTPNAIPMGFLGTAPNAGLFPGIIAGVFLWVVNIIILTVITKRLNAAGIGYSGDDIVQEEEKKTPPNPWISAIPFAVVFVLFNAFNLHIVYSLLAGTLVAIIVFWKHIDGRKGLFSVLNNGGEKCCVVLIAGSVMGGFGATIAASNAFVSVANSVVNFPGPPLFVVGIAMAIITGISGTAPAGLGVGIPMFQDIFVVQMGIDPAALHRVASFASSTFDTLPTNAVYLAMAGLAGFTVRQTYKYVFALTVVPPIIATFLVAMLLTVFPGLA